MMFLKIYGINGIKPIHRAIPNITTEHITKSAKIEHQSVVNPIENLKSLTFQ